MSAQGRKRLTTYASRKIRHCAFQGASSSPLQDIDREDITISEMSRRMKKRARQAPGRAAHLDSDDANRKAKKLKPTPNSSSGLGLDSTLPTLPTLMSNEYLISLNDGTDTFSYQTPFNQSPKSASHSVIGSVMDRMSPVPTGRRSLSRTSSRNLKENSNLLQSLASPFHSRSASKTGSPTKKNKKGKKPPFYMKTRTRSDAEPPVERDELLVSASAAESPRHKSLLHHCRRTSGSSTAYMLQQVSDEDWFRPAKALSRSPFTDDYVPPDTPLPDWSFSTEAFFGNVPRETSTPQKRAAARSDEGTPSAPNTPERTLKDATVAEADQSCSRRRTIHLSKDSIFSSSCEVTASRTSGPLLSEPDALICAPVLHSARCSPALEVTLEDILVPEALRTPCSSPGAEQLSGMMVGLDIDENKTGPSSATNPFNRPRSLDSAAEISTEIGRGHRRERAGTIRASDFMRPVLDNMPASSLSHLGAAAPVTTRTRSGTIRPARGPGIARMNSEPAAVVSTTPPVADSAGAVADNSADPISMLDSPFVMEVPGPQEVVVSGKCARIPRAAIMRVAAVDEMELDVGSETSDDELLLVAGRDWNWDGRWD
ncbi:hypothetical protein FA95DRAFT_1678089 [Auriscalpium vulgare]|uniref:Uncharacterized protein n=1 Tax=Auriscalpium vulgare TaxID=40419 RepID=A0ACB8RY55_9AGAM|nr:hypothetical protein FA95DRAFT_1678089 [Auriscalpium vulgare]